MLTRATQTYLAGHMQTPCLRPLILELPSQMQLENLLVSQIYYNDLFIINYNGIVIYNNYSLIINYNGLIIYNKYSLIINY